MKELGKDGKQWLKGAHVLVCLMLVGGGVCMLLLRFAANPADGAALHAIDEAVLLIEQLVVIPAAIGAVLTGLLESWLTQWRFFKYRWVMVKWAVTLGAIAVGSIWLGPWANEMAALSGTLGLAALDNRTYQHARLMHTLFLSIQTCAIAALPFISVIKPWMRSDKTRGTEKVRAQPLGTELNARA